MKAIVVKSSRGLQLRIVATEQAELVLLELFLAQDGVLAVSSDGSRHGNNGEVVERSLCIDNIAIPGVTKAREQTP